MAKTLQQKVVSALSKADLTLSCAESCTGGLIAKRITDVSGASAVFHGGVVSYVNAVKQNVLGVSAGIWSNMAPCPPQWGGRWPPAQRVCWARIWPYPPQA